MNVIQKLRLQFVCVFMALMVVFAGAISAAIYVGQKAELEYQCMVYLLDIHNFDNRGSGDMRALASYPPYFVIEIDNVTDTARVVQGEFFLGMHGVTTDELISHLQYTTEESGVLEEYQVRYFNGVRQARAHRVSFIDVSYIPYELHELLGRIVLFVAPSLGILLCVALLLSQWFVSTAKKAMDEQARFISKVSHELKTPLSIIRANIDLIDGQTDTSGTDFVFGCENIRHECGRMTSLIEAMLWTALPAQKVVKNTEPVDLTRLLQREMLRFEVVAFDQGLQLSLDAEEGLLLPGDETQLTRLIDIVVENAVKYCQPGGAIEVTATRRSGLGRRIRMSFANTGEEIPKEQRENIFRPFYQLDSAQKGAGLGLSIAHEIVTAMGGVMRVDYVNGKNVFIVEL